MLQFVAISYKCSCKLFLQTTLTFSGTAQPSVDYVRLELLDEPVELKHRSYRVSRSGRDVCALYVPELPATRFPGGLDPDAILYGGRCIGLINLFGIIHFWEIEEENIYQKILNVRTEGKVTCSPWSVVHLC